MSVKIKDNFGQRAFTLVEIVISTVILAIAVLGVMSAFVSGTKLVAASKYRLQAINYAQGILEGLRQEVRADTWSIGGLSFGTHYSCPGPGSNPLADFSGNCQYTVKDIDMGSDSNKPKRVDVTVTWTMP